MAGPTGLLTRGARYLDFCNFYGRMGNPRRVVSGILTVIVRNAEGDDRNEWDSGLDDMISMTEDGKGTAAVDNFILQPPFWNPDINSSDLNYPDLDIATEQNDYPITRGDVPWEHGWDRWSGIGRKKAVGDYDCFLYHVTLAVNLQEPVLMYSTEDSGIKAIDGASFPFPTIISNTAIASYVAPSTTYTNVPVNANPSGTPAYVDMTLSNEQNIGLDWIYDVTYPNIPYGGHKYVLGVQSNAIDGAAQFGMTDGLTGNADTDIDIDITDIGDCMYEGPHTTAWINAQGAAGVLPYDDYNAITNPTGNLLVDQDSGPGTLYGFEDNTDAVWYDVVDHKHCQSFVKWSLISRHNNAYDHHDWSPYPRHLNMELVVESGDLTGSESKNWANIPDGGELEEDVTVTGAVLGDYAIASMSVDTQGLQLTASVTAADTVTVVLANHTGLGINLASGTLSVLVIRSASGSQYFDRSEILWRHLNTGDETPGDQTVDDYTPNDGTNMVPIDGGTAGGLFGDYYHYGTVVNGKNARGAVPYPQGMVERDEYCMYVDEAQPLYGEFLDDGAGDTDIGYPPADQHKDYRQGLTHRRKYIFNTGTSSYHPLSLGNDMSIYANPKAEHDPDINMLRKARQGYNRFFSPVHRIDIYATHPLDKDTNKLVYDDYSNSNETVRNTVTLYKLTGGGNVHDIDFYNLVVNIQAYSFSEDGNFPEEVDEKDEKVHFYNRTQVLFQAFGETSNIRLTMTEPTS